MTVDLELLRDHVGPGPSDSDLQAALDAAVEALDARYGPDVAGVTEYLRPFGQWVKLGRRAAAVVSVLEGRTAVAAADFTLWPGGRYIRRLSDGEPVSWTAMVEVEYTPYSESSERDRVALALCDLDLTRKFGLIGITNGPWSEQYAQAAGTDYTATRQAILDSLRPRVAGVW